MLEPDGDLTLDLIGPADIVEGTAHTLRQLLRTLDQQYPWTARYLVVNSCPRRIAFRVAIVAFLFLMYFISMYIWGRIVGVDVDPNLIPEGMTYYENVAEAIASPDTEQKLNVLLMGNYRYFINVSDFLSKFRGWIALSLTAFVILSILVWISNYMTRFFPQAYFALGRRIEDLKKLEKGREMWVFGIVIAFLVNLAAGLLIAVVGT